MERLANCEFIAIFDADFKPEPDFLARCPGFAQTQPAEHACWGVQAARERMSCHGLRARCACWQGTSFRGILQAALRAMQGCACALPAHG